MRWLELLRAHHAIVRDRGPRVRRLRGQVAGRRLHDRLPERRAAAIECALAIQQAIEAELGDHPDGPIRVRIGLHSGEAIREDDDDFYGSNVSLAARIAEKRAADEILASAVVKQLAESAGDIGSSRRAVAGSEGQGDAGGSVSSCALS